MSRGWLASGLVLHACHRLAWSGLALLLAFARMAGATSRLRPEALSGGWSLGRNGPLSVYFGSICRESRACLVGSQRRSSENLRYDG